MSPIGPQLPPQLSKRKRTPDDDTAPDSPAAKVRATDRAPINDDEVDLGSDSDDSYGPAMPQSTNKPSIGPAMPPSNTNHPATDSDDDDDAIGPSAPLPATATTTTRPSIGPTLPPPPPTANTDEIPLDSESESEAGPAPAPTLASAATAAKRTHGPAAPPASLTERPPNSPPSPDSDSDSDSDGYGPALPTSSSHQQRATQARAAQAAEADARQAAAPKRDDWMLAPPRAEGYRAPDPTKLKARKFASGPRAAGAAKPDNGGHGNEISSIWTETPEEKRRRLENAVLGRGGDDAVQQTGGAHGRNKNKTKTEAELAQEARIQSFTEATRGRSLYEEHQQQKKRDKNGGRTHQQGKDEEEDDPSKRAFDKEKDMKLGGRIGTAQRRELLNKAADFGGRFAKGKYL
ncbi:hypothetical protein F4779DRAFT_20355 [Xylariaceae sp. FL0662B]|nr:hypothetical protein F4779DRAFT_20355 [Xylariaceae sp. FL0662B]